MTRLPRDLQLLVGAAAALIALWSFALVAGVGNAQEPAAVTGGAEAGGSPGTGGTSAPPSFAPAPPPSPPPAEAAPVPGDGGDSGPAAPTPAPEPTPSPSPDEQAPTPPPEGESSIPALEQPGDPNPEPAPIAPVYRPEEMRGLRSPGSTPSKPARDVSPSYGVAAVLALSDKQQEPAETTPGETGEDQQEPTVTQRGTESVEILPPEPPRPPRPTPPPPPRTYGGDVVRAVSAPFSRLAATGFQPLALAALGGCLLLAGAGLRRAAGWRVVA